MVEQVAQAQQAIQRNAVKVEEEEVART